MADSGEHRTANLRAELTRWRTRRTLSLRALAARLACDHSHLWKIENGKATFTRVMAESCDNALDAGGALIAAWVNAQTSIRPAQLPAAHGQILGRDTELTTLNEAVNEPHGDGPTVIMIDGPAGAGKTALALRWAHQVAGQFVDGNLFADLGGFASRAERVSAEDVLEAFLAALGVTAIPTTVRERAALFRSLLADRRILIMLDNAADDSGLHYLLPASANCAVVVTSRRILAGLVSHAGTRLTVGPLAEPHSISLVTGLFGDARARAAPDAVIRMVRLCGHLPLALRVVAEHVATYPHRSINKLLDELTDTDDRLAVAETEELHSAFSSSYRHLTPDTARLFRLLGLHPTPHLNLSAVAALVGLTTPQARRLLHQLASLHLITIESDQVIKLDELTYAYARDLITTEDDHEQRGAATQRLASWYLTAAHAAGRHLLPGTSAKTAGATPAQDRGNDSVHGAVAADDVDTTIFADDRAARAWCDHHLGNYRSLMRLALAYDPDRTAPQLAAELGLIGQLHTEIVRPRPPADPPSTSRATSPLGRRAPLDVLPAEFGQANPPPDRPPGDRPADVAMAGALAKRDRAAVSSRTSRTPHDDPRGDHQPAGGSRGEVGCTGDTHEQDQELVERLREATARLVVA